MLVRYAVWYVVWYAMWCVWCVVVVYQQPSRQELELCSDLVSIIVHLRTRLFEMGASEPDWQPTTD